MVYLVSLHWDWMVVLKAFFFVVAVCFLVRMGSVGRGAGAVCWHHGSTRDGAGS